VRLRRILTRLAGGLMFIVTGVAIAKMAQYAAVDAFGERLGFDLASAVGVFPILAALLLIDVRYLRPRRQADHNG
jgi:hypothetical protein